MKKKLFYLEYYLCNLPFYIYHELCHYIILIMTFLLALNSFPKLIITQWAYCEYCTKDDNLRTQHSFKMHVSYINYWDFEWLDKICAFMPIPGLVILFWISPWYLYPYYLSHINTLWLSEGDIKTINS